MRVKVSLFVFAAFFLLLVLSLGRLRAVRANAPSPTADPSPAPVLVELFTSEGCSDCPPADALLQKFDHSRPVAAADLIVLSEHVDYWDDIGWRDPYSSHEYSERQDAYAARFRLPSVYTPQMVVDGRFQLVGSDERGALSAIESAAKFEKIQVSISSVRWAPPNSVALHVEADPLPSSIASKSAEVWLAAADDSDESHVTRGENGGRTLVHVAVLRTLSRAGTVDRYAGLSRDVKISLDPAHARSLRLIAFVQEPAAGRVWGVASARLSN